MPQYDQTRDRLHRRLNDEIPAEAYKTTDLPPSKTRVQDPVDPGEKQLPPGRQGAQVSGRGKSSWSLGRGKYPSSLGPWKVSLKSRAAVNLAQVSGLGKYPSSLGPWKVSLKSRAAVGLAKDSGRGKSRSSLGLH